MAERCDILVIGAGIAGASVAAELALDAKVLLIEREAAPGYHATGRSAAMFVGALGNETIRALSAASFEPLRTAQDNFTANPVLSPRGTLLTATIDQTGRLAELVELNQALGHSVLLQTVDEAIARIPLLRRDHLGAAALLNDDMQIDVNELLQGFLVLLRDRGGAIKTSAAVTQLATSNGDWIVQTSDADYAAPIVVNAAGAWADDIARRAGVTPIGLTPKRRSVGLVKLPDAIDATAWPMVVNAEEQYYFRPEAGLLLISAVDATPSEPCDAQPEELDLAIAADQIEQALDFKVRRIESSWAGLRTFTKDETPAVGYDSTATGFFWLAGQGGVGIQTSPAMARVAATLVHGNQVPADLQDRGITADALSPTRFA